MESSNSSSVMPSVHMHNIESISVPEETTHLQNHANMVDRLFIQNDVRAQILTHNIYDAHTYFVALKIVQ